MSEPEEIQYVRELPDGNIQIFEEGFIDGENINGMTFTFSEGKDITESLHKKQTEQSKKISTTHNGRTGYASITCTYPNGTDTSSKVVLKDCVIQYIKGMHRDGSRYARDYVFIGIPEIYLSKISKDAHRNSSINVAPKDTEKLMSGYNWIRCNLENLDVGSTSMTIVDNGRPRNVNINVFEVLDDLRCHVLANITFTISASMTSKTMIHELDLENGRYHFSVKPTQVSILRDIDVEAPTIADTERRNKERSEIGESAVASSKVAQLAMKRLKIKG